MSKIIRCNTEAEIISNGGTVIQNNDGTVSVYTPNTLTGRLTEIPLTKVCCEALRTPKLFFDENRQKCYWSRTPNNNLPFNIVLNPKGNDGAIFSVEPNDTCTLTIEFDYLFRFSGDTLTDLANGNSDSNCKKVIDVFESLGASAVISTVIPTNTGVSIQPVYENNFFPTIGAGNLYTYLSGKSADTGFYITCTSTSDNQQYPINLYDLNVNNNLLNCSAPINQLVTSLFDESGIPQNSTGATQFRRTVDKDAFASNWLNVKINVTDPNVIGLIENEKIKLNIKLSGVCVDFCVLVDNVKLNKNCTSVTNESIFITKSPGFELDRIRDNKKSWVAETNRTRRVFKVAKYNNTKPIRYTDYFVDDYRQVINSKEIDLDINIASAVETDVWAYMSDNPCLLTGVTIGTTTKTKDTLQTVPAVTTATSFSTEYVVVYTACTVEVVSSTTVTTPGSTAYTCEAGFSATPANDQCQFVDIQIAAPPATSPSLITPGSQNEVYGSLGAWFYPPVTSSSNLPYSVSLIDGNLVDSLNNVITPLAINNTNTFWWSQNNPSIITQGRLNNIGLFAPDKIGNFTNWVGFSKCLNISEGGVYYIGLAADNYCRFKVNGTLIAEFKTLTEYSFVKWHVFPITLNSGLNFIEMEGLNQSGDKSFGAEIYYPTGATPFATLTAATSTAATQANVIFSTAEYILGNYQIGGGYTCPSGYILNYCDGPTPTCAQVITKPINVTITPPKTTTVTTLVPSATTCPGKSAITVSSIVTAITSTTVCLPQEYCASEYCGDANINLKNLLTQPLSSIQTIEDFDYYLTSELIDAKDRKTLSSYPTLRLLYDRYMNSTKQCTTNSSKFDYYSMNNFANLVGNYWIDLIEQVIPATTIWGSTRIYSNTLFDSQKFQYKSYSSLFGNNIYGNLKPSSPATGRTCNTHVITKTVLGNASGTTLFTNQGNEATFNSVYLLQTNSGSEFFGSVRTVGKNSPCGDNTINNCDLLVEIEDNILKDGTLRAIPISPIGNVSYNWTTPLGEFNSQSVIATSSGLYTVKITDDCCEATKTFNRGSCNLSITLTITNPDASQNNGSITVTPSGQAGSITYSWSNGATTQTINGLSAGTYTVTATDTVFDNCTATATTTLYEVFPIVAQNITGASIWNILSTSNYDIDWGDGVVSAFTAGNNFMTSAQGHIYQAPYSPYNGNINIRSLNLSGVMRLYTDLGGPSGGTGARLIFSGGYLNQLTSLTGMTALNAHLSGDTAQLPRTLKELTSYNGKLYGNTANLPTGMTYLNITSVEQNTISGDTLGLPRNLTSLAMLGNNTISGNTSGIPTGLTYMEIAGNNTISGDVANLPRTLTEAFLRGFAQPVGLISNMPSGLTSVGFVCFDKISGDVQTISGFTNLTYLQIENANDVVGFGNQITGDIKYLNKGIRTMVITGFNTLSGDIKDMPTGTTTPTGYFDIRGNNTISGDTSGIATNFEVIIIGGQNEISGDLGSITTNAKYIDIGGRNSIDTYTGKTWINGMHTIKMSGTPYNTGYTTSQLDQLFIDLTGYTWSNNSSFSLFNRFGPPRITLKGTASTVSDAARTKLSGSTGSGGFGVIITLQ